jgi:aminoacylase
VFYGERASWSVRVVATGPVGHGSRFIENTAMEKLIAFINKALAFRQEQFAKYTDHECGYAVAVQ